MFVTANVPAGLAGTVDVGASGAAGSRAELHAATPPTSASHVPADRAQRRRDERFPIDDERSRDPDEYGMAQTPDGMRCRASSAPHVPRVSADDHSAHAWSFFVEDR